MCIRDRSEEEEIVDPQDTDTEEDGSEPEVEETSGETEDSDSEVNLYKFFGEQLKKDGHLDDTFEAVSYTHLPSPRDRTRSRMPSSA